MEQHLGRIRFFAAQLRNAVMAFGLALLLAGCGDSSVSSSHISGTAMDGYLSGALAFYDLDDNGEPDSGEPNGMTSGGGQYSLTLNTTDLGAHKVMLKVIAGQTMDSDNPGVPISIGYTLATTADHPEIISPLTTLVVAAMNAAPGLSSAQAEAQVKLALGLSASSVSLFDDFAGGASGNGELTILANWAKVIRAQMQASAAANPAAGALSLIQSAADTIRSGAASGLLDVARINQPTAIDEKGAQALVGNAAAGVSTHTVSGKVSGLAGSVILQNNNGDNLIVSADGTFTFNTVVARNKNYSVTVLSQPTGQTCSVSAGAGTVWADVTNVSIICAASTHSVGGTVSGLAGTLVLQNNHADNLTVSASGAFTFATKLAYDSIYSVTVLTQPAGQTCSVSTGAGTVETDVSNVSVVCAATAFNVGGTVFGLAGSVVLQNNNGDKLTVSANGDFAFAAKIASGGAYSVTVLTHPAQQSCSVASGTGTISSANVTSVRVSCAANTYTIGGAVSGLAGSVVLQNNGADDLTVSVNGPFAFATAIAKDASYDVTVLTQPTGQTCSVSAGAGTVGNRVSNVSVVCATNAYSVGGTISGLAGSVVLQDNNADNLTIAANGAFSFATKVANGSHYSVTVLTQPTGQSCSVAGGTGTIVMADVTGISVTCAANFHTIGGSVSGLTGSMVLQNNGADNLTVSANGPFTFAAALPFGNTYDVTVLTQPADLSCVTSGGSGTVSGNVTSVAVACGCLSGYTSCSSVCVNTQTDPTNCGTCGAACADGYTCSSGICAPPTCTDGVKNGTETSIDCGGASCSACADGKGCVDPSDCVSSVCTGNVCQAAACADLVKNGTETDVDCGGGSCASCADGAGCALPTDCTSSVCVGNVCLVPTCSDLVKNGAETDVDCGGGTCPACADGKECATAANCASSVCTGNVCQAPSCSDGVQNGGETSTDCGGGVCTACGAGNTCSVNGDCSSSNCQNGKCVGQG